tara:strand:+ start:3801 stop:4100 length:300 start_codon:yes stop_codon:yes gene_type:complete
MKISKENKEALNVELCHMYAIYKELERSEKRLDKLAIPIAKENGIEECDDIEIYGDTYMVTEIGYSKDYPREVFFRIQHHDRGTWSEVIYLQDYLEDNK